MATLLAPGQVLRASAWVADGAQASVNTWHYRVVANGASPATDQDFANNIDAIIATALKAIIYNGATYKGIVAQIIFPVATVDVSSITGAGVGIAGANQQPKQVSGITSWYTGLAGRRFRGRTFWPFTSTSDNSSGVPTGSYVTRITTLTNLIANFVTITAAPRTSTVQLVIWHRKPLFTTDDVVSSFPRSIFSTQRKRGDYGRTNSPPI